MRRWVWLAVVLVACSAPPSASTGSPAGGPTTPSPATCRLPVIEGSPGQGGGPQTPGFLTIPGLIFSPATGAGDGEFYDRPLARWVPWGPPNLSDDGLLYAYVEGDQTSSRIHLVDLRTNADTVLAAGGPWRAAPGESSAFSRTRFMSTASSTCPIRRHMAYWWRIEGSGRLPWMGARPHS